MKVRSVITSLGALTLVAVLGLFTPADAGEDSYVAVDKVVDGPVPAGTVFEVEVKCKTDGDFKPAVTLKFDAAGDPLDADMVFVGNNGTGATCEVAETITGGAAVSYTCADDGLVAECLDQQTIGFAEQGIGEATVTVSNTFEPEPEAAPADAVAARPSFTG